MSLLEAITLKGAMARAKALAPSVRERVQRHMSLGNERARAARVLWDAELRAQALPLMMRALEDEVGAARALDDDSPSDAPPAWDATIEATCTRLGLSSRRTKDIEAAYAARGPVPDLDAQITAAHQITYERLDRAASDLHCALATAAATRGNVVFRRALRVCCALFVIGVAAVALWAMNRPRVTAVASGEFAPTFPAAHAIDGKPDTEWLLPERTVGTLTLHFQPPRDVASVELLNAKNAPHFDRAAKDYVVELSSHGRVVATAQGSFAALDRHPSPVTARVAAEDVDTLQVRVTSHHGRGGGLAEVTVR